MVTHGDGAETRSRWGSRRGPGGGRRGSILRSRRPGGWGPTRPGAGAHARGQGGYKGSGGGKGERGTVA